MASDNEVTPLRYRKPGDLFALQIHTSAPMPEPQADELAGRALDAEVARRVFGHTVREDAPHGFDYRATSGPNNYEHWARVPPYSSEIGAAWAVWIELEKWGLRPPAVDALRELICNSGDGWRREEALYALFTLRSEEAAALICRAALAAAADAPTRGDVGE